MKAVTWSITRILMHIIMMAFIIMVYEVNTGHALDFQYDRTSR
jgi:hypothetical protein